MTSRTNFAERFIERGAAFVFGAIFAFSPIFSGVATPFGRGNAVDAAQTARVLTKDGRVYNGAIFPTSSVFENEPPRKEERASTPVKSEKILAIDDELRRIYIPKNAVADVLPDDASAGNEKFEIPQRVDESLTRKIATLGPYRASTPFDEFGRRVIAASGTSIAQGITEISPTYVRVRGANYNVDMRLSPRAIPRETLTALIKKRLDPKSLDDRLRVYQFYLQGELYEQAAAELQEIIDEFQNDDANERRLDDALRTIKRMAAQQLIDELELRRAAGQYKKTRELLETFDSDKTAPEKLQAIRRLKREMEEEAKRRDRVVERVRELADGLEDAELKKAVEPIVVEIAKDLTPNSIGRFAAFEQSEHDGSLQDAERLALALSGWLVGNAATDRRLEVAVSMYRVRLAARRYLLEKRPDFRRDIWEQIRAEEASSPEIVAKLISTMKPPESRPSSSRETPNLYKLSVPSFQDGKTFEYWVQLPPEYDPQRKYPTIVTLHGERSTPEQQLNWWCGPWVERTNAQGKKTNERYGQATRFGYIVVAPRWTEPGLGYDHSAIACAATLTTLRDAERKFSIDPDRVFLSGFLAGGDAAWDIALAHPDLWAGVVPICGGARYLTAKLKRNGRFVPLYAIGGELDGGNLAASKTVLDWGMDLSRPFDMTYVQFKGRGGEPFSEETTRVFEWMRGRSRRFFSPDEREAYSVRPWDNFFWNVELFEFDPKTTLDPIFAGNVGRGYEPAKTEFFKIVDNKVRIRSDAARGIVFLSPELVDFDRKIEVTFNGKKISPADGKIPASSRVILEDVRTRCDRVRPFWATLNSAFPGEFNEWDGER